MGISEFQFIESMLASHTPEAEAAVVAFARHFATYPLTLDNVHIYQKILQYNNTEAVDAILKRRNPDSFFSTIEPDRSLVVFALSTLAMYRSEELYKPVVLVCLGILQNVYKNPGHGISVYSLSVSDIYHTAKYLKNADEPIETLLISFLENLNTLSRSNNISNIAGNIIDAFFDNSKKIESIIPSSILL
ncbi:MAG: hypothetical protein DRP58_11630 [Spirochaetes bacterium]|nr:MAG: hypothetical protein DRP58_11630 [Spirochaetota bacterium]